MLQGYNSTLTMLGAGSSSSIKIEDSSMNQDNSSLPSDNNISSNDLDDEVPF